MIVPPAVGPMIAERPKTPMTTPIQRPRSRGEKMSPIVAVESAIIAPPPIPATMRAPTSQSIDWAIPASTDPTM